nr:immunoglobulin heavy chain junction region [Macaca mulatta]MOV86583.1 immunoglobulin heavy chain junction region [Macaca mulatta]MOV86605.1 immunoglobulin heavy chain junction region [Macaca mulatta]MOV86611.1 immunoglobulin heavy chain junction region [Macaca mulatta]MOV86667.1 immunoglobulin heavy chain junction region [Macaca mulatta]
CAKKEDDFDYW